MLRSRQRAKHDAYLATKLLSPAIGSRPGTLKRPRSCPAGWCLAPIAETVASRLAAAFPVVSGFPLCHPMGANVSSEAAPPKKRVCIVGGGVAGWLRRRRAAAGRPASTWLGWPLLPAAGASKRAFWFPLQHSIPAHCHGHLQAWHVPGACRASPTGLRLRCGSRWRTLEAWQAHVPSREVRPREPQPAIFLLVPTLLFTSQQSAASSCRAARLPTADRPPPGGGLPACLALRAAAQQGMKSTTRCRGAPPHTATTSSSSR